MISGCRLHGSSQAESSQRQSFVLVAIYSEQKIETRTSTHLVNTWGRSPSTVLQITLTRTHREYWVHTLDSSSSGVLPPRNTGTDEQTHGHTDTRRHAHRHRRTRTSRHGDRHTPRYTDGDRRTPQAEVEGNTDQNTAGSDSQGKRT